MNINRDNFLYGRHFRVRAAVPEDVAPVAADLRENDRLELERFYEEEPEEVLRNSLRDSALAWTAVSPDDSPAAVWGVAAWPIDPRYGCPWLLGTDRIKESYSDFLWLSKHYDQLMSQYFFGLTNLVDAQYSGAIRWLEWLGFKRGGFVKSRKDYDFIIMYKDIVHVR